MPFRHVVLLRWADDVPEDHVEQVRSGLDALPPQIPQIRSFLHGSDVGVSEGNYDYVVVADFDNVGDWRLFREHPAHLLFMEEHITGKFTGPRRDPVPDARRPRPVRLLTRPDAGVPCGDRRAWVTARRRSTGRR